MDIFKAVCLGFSSNIVNIVIVNIVVLQHLCVEIPTHKMMELLEVIRSQGIHAHKETLGGLFIPSTGRHS